MGAPGLQLTKKTFVYCVYYDYDSKINYTLFSIELNGGDIRYLEYKVRLSRKERLHVKILGFLMVLGDNITRELLQIVVF